MNSLPFVGLRLVLLSTLLISTLNQRYGCPTQVLDDCFLSSRSCPRNCARRIAKRS
ncbi:hypothetical protein Golob_001465 [Gossypium lobatum]|uniref:Uncharacterized protein n=1 Tax=Gossypium lobatum TaxID=34289 RepID=A0A7J8NB60_9ROSI|nr:hypothetical protein [Gossypium lobatum]